MARSTIRWRRRLAVVAAGLVASCGAGAGVAWALAWKPAPRLATPEGVTLTGEFRAYADHGAARGGNEGAYVYRISNAANGGEALIFGSIHSNRPDDPQMDRIAAAWAAFGPGAALTETTLRLHLGGREGAIRRMGEFGLLASLARRDGVPVASLEPAWDVEIAGVRRRFEKREAAAFYFLRVFVSERGDRTGEDLDGLASHLLAKRAGRPGLEGSFGALDEFDAWWEARLAGELGPWRSIPAEELWPREEGSVLSLVAFEANRARDEHFAALIVDAVGRGECVFVLVGASHALTLEPVLEASTR